MNTKLYLKEKWAFTLAEVLITLGVIGLVAVLTIPGLITNINKKVVKHQIEVMNAKIVQGLNMFNSQENGLSKSYANSEEFVRGLSKYLKMTTICGKDNLSDCFGYKEVRYGSRQCDLQGSADCDLLTVNLSTITNAKKINLVGGFLDPAAFVMADGTTAIISWNSKCASSAENAIVLDPDQPLKSIPLQCFDGLYDLSGASRPNIVGEDVMSFGRAAFGEGAEIDGIGYVVDLRSNYAPINGNYWEGAKQACEDMGMKLPDIATLERICNSTEMTSWSGDNYMIRRHILPFNGIYWSSSESGGRSAWSIEIAVPSIQYSYDKYSNINVLCVDK